MMSNTNKFIGMNIFGKYGRLGNQMFQYATMYAVSIKQNLRIKLPLIKNSTHDKCETKIIKYFKNLRYEPMQQTDVCDVTFNESNFSYNDKIFNLTCIKGINITGYFQSYKYFDNIKPYIINLFDFNNDIKAKCTSQIAELRKHNLPIVGCHVRRGDLVNYDAYGPPVDVTYVVNSINTIKRMIGDKFLLLIFSDNINYCKGLNLATNCVIAYSEGNNEGEDMCLMTMCDHMIISNSSYSWWGAYLNNNSNKIVLSKSVRGMSWFYDYIVPESARNDLLPPNFIQIEDPLELQLINTIYSTMYISEK